MVMKGRKEVISVLGGEEIKRVALNTLEVRYRKMVVRMNSK